MPVAPRLDDLVGPRLAVEDHGACTDPSTGSRRPRPARRRGPRSPSGSGGGQPLHRPAVATVSTVHSSPALRRDVDLRSGSRRSRRTPPTARRPDRARPTASRSGPAWLTGRSSVKTVDITVSAAAEPSAVAGDATACETVFPAVHTTWTAPVVGDRDRRCRSRSPASGRSRAPSRAGRAARCRSGSDLGLVLRDRAPREHAVGVHRRQQHGGQEGRADRTRDRDLALLDLIREPEVRDVGRAVLRDRDRRREPDRVLGVGDRGEEPLPLAAEARTGRRGCRARQRRARPAGRRR